MIGSMVYQLTKDASIEQIKATDNGVYYTDHDKGIYPSTGTGVPFNAAYIQSKGDPIADIHEDMAAEQKARATYEHLLDLADDPDVMEPLKFLREREIVHFQRFGEVMDKLQEYLDSKKYF
jgi:spore coat protein JC